jgi:hypothetical protein
MRSIGKGAAVQYVQPSTKGGLFSSVLRGSRAAFFLPVDIDLFLVQLTG